jgi:clan AA aspartic protease
MGFLNVKVELEGVNAPGRRHEVELLVDTGPLYSMVPASVLRKAGVEPRLRIEFEIADGSRIQRDVGEARFYFNGSSAISRVIFGDEKDAGVLGVVTLEELGLEVEPINKQVRPARMILY